jgi:Zn-finger nucleic acid-binding protein
VYVYEGVPICQIIVEIEIEIEIGIEIDPCPPWHPAFTDRSDLTVELCQHRSTRFLMSESHHPSLRYRSR